MDVDDVPSEMQNSKEPFAAALTAEAQVVGFRGHFVTMFAQLVVSQRGRPHERPAAVFADQRKLASMCSLMTQEVLLLSICLPAITAAVGSITNVKLPM